MIRVINILLMKKITFIVFFIIFIGNTQAQVYYVSNSQGNDQNDGLSIESPFRSIDKLNSMEFNP